MSDVTQGDRHNYSNPRCPDCGGISAKHGILKRKWGKLQRYRCIDCGRTFQKKFDE